MIEKEVFLKLILKEQHMINQVNKGGNVTGIGAWENTYTNMTNLKTVRMLTIMVVPQKNY